MMARCGKAIWKISTKVEETVLVGEWQILWPKILNIDMTSESFIHQRMHYLLILENSKIYIKT
jgi:hypothetical protein